MVRDKKLFAWKCMFYVLKTQKQKFLNTQAHKLKGANIKIYTSMPIF